MFITKHFDLPGQRIAYAEAGVESDAAPVILLHGGAVDHRMWTPQLSAFEGRRVIAPDARGHGESSDAGTAYRLTDDLIALLDALELERVVLVGLSMGGGTAVDAALEYSERVAALIVSGCGTSEPDFIDPWSVDIFTRWQSAEQHGDLEAWIEAFMAFTTGPGRARDDVDASVYELVEAMARETIANHLRLDAAGVPIPPTPPTPVAETWQRLPTIRVPALALCGTDDGADHLRMTRRLAHETPCGGFRALPGAHYPNLEAPEAFNDVVRDFLSRHAL